MNKVTVKENDQYDIELANDSLIVNGKAIALDTLIVDDHTIHVLYDNKSFNVELVELDRVEKQAKIKINGNVYQVNVTTQLDLLLKQLGMDNLSANKVLHVKAPMPGLVLSVLVTDGQEVKKGDSLLILEAMKMENIIKSPTDGTIQKVEVTQGNKIEKNTILIKFS